MSRTYQFANEHILFIHVYVYGYVWVRAMDVTVVVAAWSFIYHFLATFGMGLIQVRWGWKINSHHL